MARTVLAGMKEIKFKEKRATLGWISSLEGGGLNASSNS